jgi:hypothetical protein
MSDTTSIMHSSRDSIRVHERGLPKTDVTLILEVTSHAAARLRQRGLRETDAQLIVELGTESRSGVFILTNSDANALIAELSVFADPQHPAWHGMSAGELKRRIDGLRGATVVAEGLTVITVFHNTTSDLRTDPRRDPRCRRRRQRREAERRRRSFHLGAHWPRDLRP